MVERARSTRQTVIVAEPQSNGWGGRRQGAGGGPKRLEVRSLKNEVLTLRAKYRKMPLDHMLSILNTEPPPPPALPPPPPDPNRGREPVRNRNRRRSRDEEEEEEQQQPTPEEYARILDDYEKKLAEHKAAVEKLEKRQDWAAVQAAPFMHHRLSSIEISGPDGGPIRAEKVDITKLNDTELDALEKLVRKAAVVTLDEDQYHEVD